MKKFLQRLARRAGFVVVTAGHASARYVEHVPSGPFDEILLRSFPDLNGLNFIQIGANDGLRGDPIRKYVTSCHWSGVLVEPDPALFRALQQNYAAESTRLRFLNAAIDTAEGERALFQIDPATPDLVEWARGVVSFDRSHVARIAAHLKLPDAAIHSSRVRTATWEELKKIFGPRHCDVLVVDVEGYDAALLRLADLPRLKPTVIQFEHGCLARDDRLALYGELIDLGYELATHFIDTIAYLPPGSAQPHDPVAPR
jgi:FkbM family methyltransferase